MAIGQTALMAGRCERKEFHYSDLCTWHSTYLGPKCGNITSTQPCSSCLPTCAFLLSFTAPPAQQKALPHLANIPVTKKLSWNWGYLGSSAHSTNQLDLAEPRSAAQNRHRKAGAVSSAAVSLQGGVFLCGEDKTCTSVSCMGRVTAVTAVAQLSRSPMASSPGSYPWDSGLGEPRSEALALGAGGLSNICRVGCYKW